METLPSSLTVLIYALVLHVYVCTVCLCMSILLLPESEVLSLFEICVFIFRDLCSPHQIQDFVVIIQQSFTGDSRA